MSFTPDPNNTDPHQVQPVQAPDSDQPVSNAGAPSGQPQQPQAQPASNSPQMSANVQPQTDNSNHPLVRHASILHDIAQTLAGGPRYSESIDPNTGKRTLTPVKMDRKDIGMAIALSAIQGSLAGLQAKGPNATAQAAGRGFDATAQSREKADQQASEKTQQDFVNQQTALAANLRTRNMAQEIGQREEQAHKDWINAHAPTVAAIREKYPDAVIGDNMTEAEVKDPAFTQQALKNGWIAIPTDSVPRFDEKGNHYAADGTSMYDNLYMVVEPRKIPVPDAVMQASTKAGLPGFVNGSGQPINLSNLELRLSTITDINNRRFALQQEQRDLNDYYDYLAAKGIKGKDGKPLQTPNLQQAIKDNPSLMSFVVNDWARHFGDTPGAALRAMKDNLPAKGPISALYGGQNVLDQYDNLKAADKAADNPEKAAQLQHTQLENKKLKSDLAAQNAQGQGLAVPKGFSANPNASQMNSDDLKKDLKQKGVNVPENFEALYSVAHNSADLKTLPANPRKGSNQMSAQEGLSFIRQFINPQYQEGDYAAASGLSKELASTRQGTAGGSLLSAGVASNHLDLLEQASTALANHDVKALNKIANTLGVQFGESPAVTFKAIAEQVNGEVGKVVAGGTPHEAELAQLRENLNSDQSPQQVRNVIKSYIGLMAGRVNEINDRSQQYFGRDVKGISPVVSRVFNKYGFAVGSQVQVADPSGKVHIFPNQVAADQFRKMAGIQ